MEQKEELEQLVVIVKSNCAFHADVTMKQAVELQKADFFNVKAANGLIIKIKRSEVVQWWERDNETKNIVTNNPQHQVALFHKEDEAGQTMFQELYKLSRGTIQPLQEFTCDPKKQKDVISLMDYNGSSEDNFIDDETLLELAQRDDFKHKCIYGGYLYICWTNKKDYEKAIEPAKSKKDGSKGIRVNDVDVSEAIKVDENDFYFLNERDKIYAYMLKQVEMYTPDYSLAQW